jgi:hypothetical protein
MIALRVWNKLSILHICQERLAENSSPVSSNVTNRLRPEGAATYWPFQFSIEQTRVLTLAAICFDRPGACWCVWVTSTSFRRR